MDRLIALPLIALIMLVGCDDSALPRTGPGQSGSERSGSEQNGSGQPRATPIKTTLVEPQPFRDVIQLTGTVETLKDATLSAQAAGTVTALAELGTFVAAGEVVARLDPREMRAAVRQAQASLASVQAEYKLALADYQRGQVLHQSGVISDAGFQELKARLKQAEAAVKQAEAQLAQAQEKLADTRINAPFAGTVEQHFVDQGEQITPGQPVARVVNTGRVRIVAAVPERYANDIEVGAPVRLRFSAYDDVREQSAQVTFVSRIIDPQSRTFTVEIEKPNPQGLLQPGMVLRLFLTREIMQNALVIPRRAIVRDETGASVFVLVNSNSNNSNGNSDAGPTVRMRKITLGADSAGRVLVTSGLAPGAKVVIAGQDNLVPGDPVKVIESVDNLHKPAEESGPGAEP